MTTTTNTNASNKNAIDKAAQAALDKAAKEQAAIDQAAIDQAEKEKEQAEIKARYDFILDEIKGAIKTMLKSESEALTEIMSGFYKLPSDMLQGVTIPSKLATKTSGKVLSWALDNHSDFLALLTRIIDASKGKEITAEQAIVKAIAIIKAHFVVKPYSDLF